MKIKLVFGRTCTDYQTTWTDTKEVDAEVPDSIVFPNDGQGMRHIIGVVMPEAKEQIGGANEG